MSNRFETVPKNPERGEKSEEDTAWESKARKIAGQLDYQKIIGDLDKIHLLEHNKTLLECQKERVCEKFQESVDQKDFPTKEKLEKVWEMLTVLELFDSSIAQHCVDTYVEAKTKIEKILFYPIANEKFKLADFIETEVDLERFYMACILHDIGKIAIPTEILNNKTTRKQWQELLENMVQQDELSAGMLEKIGPGGEKSSSKQEILQQIETGMIQANQIVPIEKVLSKEEIEKIESAGFSSQESLMDHIKKHEPESERTLKLQGFPVVAAIAGQHHNYFHKEVLFPLATGSLHISNELATIVHLADVQKALESQRSYKQGFPLLKTLSVLVDETKREKTGLSKEMAYFWIKDGYSKISPEKSTYFDEEEMEYAKNIDQFLEETEKGDTIEKWLEKYKKAEKANSAA
jgi:hypothetical protein